jgi:hypothetical protein
LIDLENAPEGPVGVPARQRSGRPIIHPELVQERRIRALDLRREGYTYRQIGDSLGVSHVTSYKDVQKAMGELAKVETERAEAIRRIELQRLDGMWRGLWDGATSGDPASIRAALGVMERRAKLLGLDAPSKTEHSGNISFVELASMLELEAPTLFDQNHSTATSEGDDG